MDRNRTIAAAACALLALVSPLSCKSVTERGVIRIGVINSLTGEFAAFGEQVRDGLDLAVEQLNAKGGIRGSKIELVVEDDGSNQERAQAAFEKLATQAKVVAIVGPISSGATRATAPLAQRYRIPQISPIAHASDLLNAGNTFLIFPTTEAVSRQAANVALDRFKAKRVAVLNPETAFGRSSTQALLEAFRGRAEVIANETFKEGQREYSAQVEAIVAANPDVVIYPSYYEGESIQITRQFQAATAARDRIIIIVIGSACQELLRDPVVASIPAGQLFFVNETFGPQFASGFTNRFKATPTTYAAAAYSAVSLVQKAIEKGGAQPGKIEQELRSATFDTAFGKVQFERSGANVGASVGLFTVRDGQLQAVR